MVKSEEATDDDYMYKFRTKRCTKKRCRNPSKCFGAHSEVMMRRVPSLGKDGLYNYIPEPCPQWQELKNCSLGKSCQRSHGWLERIFHPLLYRTKMCKSGLKNGVCREYGVYCAKAHKPTEIRNLLKIYGEDWKKHYDLSLREKTDTLSIVKVQGKCIEKSDISQSKRQSVGFFFSNNLPEKSNDRCSDRAAARGSNDTSPTSTNFSTDVQSPMLLASPPLFGDYSSICGQISDLELDGGVTSYAQLYSEKLTMFETNDSGLKNSSKSSIPKRPSLKFPLDSTQQSQGINVNSMESYSVCSTDLYFMSPSGENWKKCTTSDFY